MPIQCISNNILPFDVNVSTVVATGALVIAVATAVLAGLSVYFHWGMPATVSMSVTAGLSFLVALVILGVKCCKGIEDNRPIEERLPLPSELYPAKSIPSFGKDIRSAEVAHQLYELVKAGDVEAFRSVVSHYRKKDFSSMCFRHACVMRPVDPKESEDSEMKVTAVGHGLFDLILEEMEEGTKKNELIKIVLKNADVIDRFYKLFLKIQDKELIQLLFSKMSQEAKQDAVKEVLDYKQPENKHWNLWAKQWILFAIGSEDLNPEWLIDKVICANFCVEDKIIYISMISKKPIDEIESTVFWNNQFLSKATPLHIAIKNEQLDLIAELAKKPKLINKAMDGLTPLTMAIEMENVEIVEILLKAKTNTNAIVNKNSRGYLNRNKMREGATQQTPLMAAALSQNKKIYNLLLEKAEPSITDNPNDEKAWKAADYVNKFGFKEE